MVRPAPAPHGLTEAATQFPRTAPVRGIRYYSPADLSGYGQAAVANVRAFVNAGWPVQWIPLDWHPDRLVPGAWQSATGVRPLLMQANTTGHLADIGTLVERTRNPVDHDVVIVHAPPESWPALFEAGLRNVGCTVWETDRTPAHWLHSMRTAWRVVVPSTHNRDSLRRGGLDRPIAVVPHIRRHRWCEFSAEEIAATRADLDIPPQHRVFYTINTWDPRKALPDLIDAFARAFTADDPVTLLIKTRATGHGDPPLYATRATRELAAQASGAVAQRLGRAPASIVLHDEDLDGDALDLIHAIGDVYVSLSHGEGWGLGAFEAATLGKPVLMTGWGGQTDFLGAAWSGALPFRRVPAPYWPPRLPSYFPSQRWAQVDLDAAAIALRRAFQDSAALESTAAAIREHIVQAFAEPVVINQWDAALRD